MSDDALEEVMAKEQALGAMTAAKIAIEEARNELESKILELRALVSDAGAGMPAVDSAVLSPLLEAAEDWMWEGERTREEFAAKTQELQLALETSSPAYMEAVAAKKSALEAELAAESAAREAREAAEAMEAGEVEDHDTRRLKPEERLRKMRMNKEEGNTLLKDGNLEWACTRYMKALTHAGKLHDATPEQTSEAAALSLSCHLNLSQAYLKLGMLPKCIGSCSSALEIDPTSVKALYRRAMAYYKQKDIEKSRADVTAALAIKEDPAIKKLAATLDAIVAKQKAKERNMAKKMFG
jgi:tetratricopeptide (TPR) repeat protein